MQFASDVDEATKKKIAKGRIVTEILKQSDLAPIIFEKQVLILYAALNDYFNKFNPDDMQAIEKKFFEYVENLHKDFLDKIKEQRMINDEDEAKMKQIIVSFVEAN